MDGCLCGVVKEEKAGKIVVGIEIIGHIIITVLAVTALTVKLEHRLTKIETDVEWIKQKINTNLNGDLKNEERKNMDKS